MLHDQPNPIGSHTHSNDRQAGPRPPARQLTYYYSFVLIFPKNKRKTSSSFSHLSFVSTLCYVPLKVALQQQPTKFFTKNTYGRKNNESFSRRFRLAKTTTVPWENRIAQHTHTEKKTEKKNDNGKERKRATMPSGNETR